MIQIIQKISVEVSKPNFFQAIVAKQYDSNSRYLKATLIQDNEKINVANTSTVTINAKRNDGAEKSFKGEVNEDGTVTVPLTYWMLELNGRLDCDISIFGADESKLTSTTFTVEVERASCGSDDVSDADDNDIIIVQAKDIVSKEELAAAVNQFKRVLTAEDDLDSIFEDGWYMYNTSSRPANAPFENAGIIEVFGVNSTSSQKIQRAYRYGSSGFSAFRPLYSGKWLDWHFPLTTKDLANSVVTDYVVAEGASGKWTYRKWFSGVAEAWGTVDITLSKDAYAWTGDIYCASGYGTIPSNVFISYDCVSIDPIQWYQIGASGRITAGGTLEGNVFGKGSNMTSLVDGSTISVNCIVKGKWK